MRVVILTSAHHLYANYIVKKILVRKDVCQVVGIVESEVILPRKSFLEALVRLLRTSGLRFVLAQSLKTWVFRIGCVMNRLWRPAHVEGTFFPFERLLDPTVATHSTSNINSSESFEFLYSLEPDLIVLILFGQILGENVLEIPGSGCINIHPSLLPRHRGLMPIFWALSMDDHTTGVTIHFVDKGIDTGQIIVQSTLPIAPGDSEHSLYSKACHIGAELLVEAITMIRDGSHGGAVTANDSQATYHSIPTRNSVVEFLRNGRRFFRLRELMQPVESL